MDNFTLAVLIGGVVVFAFFAILLIIDKKEQNVHPTASGGSVAPKPVGKRPV